METFLFKAIEMILEYRDSVKIVAYQKNQLLI